jgi:hypothetical protein
MPSNSKIDIKLLEIEHNLVSRKHDITSTLIENTYKFVPYMTEDQRDFFNSLKYAFINKLEWKSAKS